MYDLTGLDSYDWLAIGLILSGLGLLVLALAPSSGKGGGYRRLIPFVAGMVTIVVGAATQPKRSIDVFVKAVTTFPAVAVVIGLLIVIFFGLRILDRWLVPSLSDFLTRRTRLSKTTSTDLVISLAVSGLGGLALWAFLSVDPSRGVPDVVIEQRPEAAAPFRIGWSVDLPGHPLGIAHHAPSNSLYVTLGEGSIIHIRLGESPTSQPGVPLVVATDLIFPRGIATVGDRLYVAETGELACDTTFPACRVPELRPTDPSATVGALERRILESSRGRILEYRIESDGGLEFLRDLVVDLPTVNTDHAVNGLTVGRDGYLYAAVGGPDGLAYEPDEFQAATHPNKELLGTVLRIDPTSGQYEVVARGLRNVYEITHDPNGVLWGVDNDGGSLAGHRREELLRIVDGAHFGFPADGSAPPFQVRTDSAAYTLAEGVVGSGGTQWVQGVEGLEGVLMGSLAEISFLRLTIIDGAYKVPEVTKPYRVIADAGWFVSVESIGDRAAVYALYGPNLLRLLSWED